MVKCVEVGDAGLNDLFKGLLSSGAVDGLVVPQKSGKSVIYTLIADPEKIKNPVPFAPSFGFNAANSLRKWLIEDKILGVVFKPCEARAVNELIKLKQINPDAILLISVDCEGTFKNEDYTANADKIGDKLTGNIEGVELRAACTMCETKLGEIGDLGIAYMGLGGTTVIALNDKGEAALSKVEGLAIEDKEIDRSSLKAEIKSAGSAGRETLKKELERVNEPLKLLEVLNDCIVCKNCRDMCPVCYCKECFFEQPLGNPHGGDLLHIADTRGDVRIPPYSLFYHLTRAYHVCVTCVSCGACEDACPKGLPLTLIYPVVAKNVQDVFEYVPGADLEEPLPLTTYEEDELEPR
ncbi:MAG: 4Fe-4S dicluster domain-containing protein [Candidatus Syntropharchaeales archaeon]